MIDTLFLYLTDYEIEPKAQVKINTLPYSPAQESPSVNPILYRDTSGRAYEGSNAYINAELAGGSWHFDLKRKGDVSLCFVHFSVPKIHNRGSNFYSAGREGSTAAIKAVETDMRWYGVNTDLMKAQVSRVDLAHTIQPEYSFAHYVPLFRLLMNTAPVFDTDTGTVCMRAGSSRRALVIYDKIKEMQDKGQDTSPYPEKAIRFEYRLQKAQAVRSQIGVNTTSELMDKDTYHNVKAELYRQLHDRLYRYEPGNMGVLVANHLQEQLGHFKGRGGKRYTYNWLVALGYQVLLEKAGRAVVEEVFRKDCQPEVSEAGRKRFQRHKSELKKVEQDFGIQSQNLERLYQELKDKTPVPMFVNKAG